MVITPVQKSNMIKCGNIYRNELLTTLHIVVLFLFLEGQPIPNSLGLSEAMRGENNTASTPKESICRCEDSPLVYQDMCFLHSYDTLEQKARGIVEGIIVIWSFIYLAIAAKETTFNTRGVYLQSMALCPSRVGFLLACLLVLLAVPLRLACQPTYEDPLASLIMLLVPLYSLFFCRGFKTTGPFVTMIYRMMAADLLRFVIIYSIFVLGFSQAYYIIFISLGGGGGDGDDGEEGGDDEDESSNPMDTAVESIISNFIMSLGNFGDYWEEFENTEHELAAKIHCFLFLGI